MDAARPQNLCVITSIFLTAQLLFAFELCAL
jgi:hypothetical protein